MDFLFGQETMSSLQWILRATTAFFFMVVVAKLMGQRSISQLRLLDFIMALIIGSIISHPLADHKAGMTEAFLTISVMVFLYMCGIFSTQKSLAWRRFLSGTPITIVQNGEILYKSLKKARISIDFLLEELREKKVEDIKKVALATFEASGKISVFLQPSNDPVTSAQMQIQTLPFFLPVPIIKDGQIDRELLAQAHKDEAWVKHTLKNSYQIVLDEVLLATIDNQGHLSVFLYK